MVQKLHMKCTGCNACKAVCKFDAISIISQEDGFWYPHIDESKCTNCGECLRKCPVANTKDSNSYISDIYAAWNLDEKIRHISSSGGIFSVIAENIIDNGGYVVGAAFNTNITEVKHIIINKKEDLALLRGSKYLQSYISETIYKKVLELLKNGKCVLFSGTPCQVAGMKRFLQIDYKEFITVDIICHGVPSPQVWQKYLEYMKKKYLEDIVNAQFRSKNHGWKKYEMELTFKTNHYSKWFIEDLYGKSFINNMFLRECCYNCIYKSDKREADISLGDFWKAPIKYDKDDKGTSLVIINSCKGREIFDEIKNRIFFEEILLEEAYPGNYALYRSSGRFQERERAFEMLKKKDFEQVINYYYGNSLMVRIRRKIHKIKQRLSE